MRKENTRIIYQVYLRNFYLAVWGIVVSLFYIGIVYKGAF